MNLNTRRVYICHPYSKDIKGNIKRVQMICRKIIKENRDKIYEIVPVPPQLFLGQYFDENEESREEIMKHCLALLKGCDKMWVYRSEQGVVTRGMIEEIHYASCQNIPFVFKEV